MKLLAHFMLLVTSANALSLYNPSDAGSLSQRSVLRNNLGMGTTVREPIRMPSQTPMVPYKVRRRIVLASQLEDEFFGLLNANSHSLSNVR